MENKKGAKTDTLRHAVGNVRRVLEAMDQISDVVTGESVSSQSDKEKSVWTLAYLMETGPTEMYEGSEAIAKKVMVITMGLYGDDVLSAPTQSAPMGLDVPTPKKTNVERMYGGYNAFCESVDLIIMLEEKITGSVRKAEGGGEMEGKQGICSLYGVLNDLPCELNAAYDRAIDSIRIIMDTIL